MRRATASFLVGPVLAFLASAAPRSRTAGAAANPAAARKFRRSKLGDTEGPSFSQLPNNVAQHAKELALNLAWYSSKLQFGSRDEALAHQDAAQSNWEAMRGTLAGLFDEDVLENFVDEFRWLAQSTAQFAASIRANQPADIDRVQDHLNELKSMEELKADLVSNMKGMCWSAAWVAANNCTGYTADATSNLTSFTKFAQLIGNETVLRNVSFHPEQAKVTWGPQSRVIGSQSFHNDAGVQQTMNFQVQYVQGTTTSFWNMPNIGISIPAAFPAGFDYDSGGQGAGVLSARFSFNGNLAQSAGIAKGFTLPVDVPPKQTRNVNAVVQDAGMEVPVTMTVSCGDVWWTFPSTWAGTATSSEPRLGDGAAEAAEHGSGSQATILI